MAIESMASSQTSTGSLFLMILIPKDAEEGELYLLLLMKHGIHAEVIKVCCI
jgi:hypothetical protein